MSNKGQSSLRSLLSPGRADCPVATGLRPRGGGARLVEKVGREAKSEHAHLAEVVAAVLVEEPVRLERIDDVDERPHEHLVLALVQARDQPAERRDLVQHLQDLRRVDDLDLEVLARQRDERRDDRVQHKVVVGKQLLRRAADSGAWQRDVRAG
eukprot:6423060-Prymnesium_polylepis.1